MSEERAIHVTITVTVRPNQFAFKERGESEFSFQLPEALLSLLGPNFFVEPISGCLQEALKEMKAKEDESA